MSHLKTIFAALAWGVEWLVLCSMPVILLGAVWACVKIVEAI